MPNLELVQKKNLSSFRRIALGTWKTTYDPSVYGCMCLKMDEAMRYRNEFREKTGKRLTLSHMMARAIAAVMQEMPDANAILRFNRIYLRQTIGVFFQVALEDDETGEIDLSGATVHGANTMTLEEVYDDFAATLDKVRNKKDENLENTRGMFKKIPYFLLKPVLDMIGFLSYTLNLDLQFLGIPKDPFGSVMVTNIGSLGLEEAYVPLVPYSRVPLLIAMGSVVRSPIVVGDEVKVGQTMRVFATFDHRVLDGSHAAVMSRVLRQWFEDPYTYFGPIPAD